MSLKREFRTVIAPIIRWAPVTAILIVIAVTVTHRFIYYMTPEYQASSTLKIDLRDFGVKDFELFREQPSSEGGKTPPALSELEILKSRTIFSKMFDQLGWGISYFRIGEVRTSELFNDTPILVTAQVSDSSIIDHVFFLDYAANDRLIFKRNMTDAGKAVIWGDTVDAGEAKFVFSKNAKLLRDKTMALAAGDHFSFRLNSKKTLLSEVGEKNLFLKPLNADATLVKVVITHPVAEKAYILAEALPRTYINESSKNKAQQAAAILAFLDHQLDTIGNQLRESEASLAQYRSSNGLTSTRLEMDATLKERMQHNLNEVNLEMQEAELMRVNKYLSSGQSLLGFSPNFAALSDPIFKETFLRTQSLELQKQDLSSKYTENSDEIINITTKIGQLRTFLNESVGVTLRNITEKKHEVEKVVGGINNDLRKLPEQERQLAYMGRDVNQNEQLYSHLLEKRSSLSVAAAGSGSLHKIIEYPEMPEKPISPNKSLLYGLSVLLAIIAGILVSFLLHAFFYTVQDETDIELLEKFPVLGVVYDTKKSAKIAAFHPSFAIDELLSNLDVLLKTTPPNTPVRLITITSAMPNDGKTHLCWELGKAFAKTGRHVLLIDADIRKGDLTAQSGVPNTNGLCALVTQEIRPENAIMPTNEPNLHILPAGKFNIACTSASIAAAFDRLSMGVADRYDLVIADTPPLNLLPDAVPLMHRSPFSLIVTRIKKTRMRKLRGILQYADNFPKDRCFFILNGTVPEKQKLKEYKNYYLQKA